MWDRAIARRISRARQTPQPGGRDLRIDFLRGFAVLAVIVDHLGGPSPVRLITGGGHFYTSAAEGLVLLSGLVAGLSARKTVDRVGLSSAMRRLAARAWELYLLTVLLTIGVAAAGIALHLSGTSSWQSLDLTTLLVDALVLARPISFAEIPRMYAVFLVLAPVAVYGMRRGHTGAVLLGSWGLWGMQQLQPMPADLPWVGQIGFFPLSVWQAPFFTGLALGFHRQTIGQRIDQLWRRRLLVLSSIAVALMVGLFALTQPHHWAVQQVFAQLGLGGVLLPGLDLITALFDKAPLCIGRVAASVLAFPFFWLAADRAWPWLRRGLGWLCLPLGQNALAAFTLHVLLVVLLAPWMGWNGDWLSADMGLNAAVQIGCIGLILLTLRLHHVVPAWAKTRWWLVGPLRTPLRPVRMLPARSESRKTEPQAA
jgi:hypothetical protein